MKQEQFSGTAGKSVQELLERVVFWAQTQDAILAIALVGSQARGTARPESDVDLVILFRDPLPFLESAAWAKGFGTVLSLEREDWGMVQSLRVYYKGGPEVEFGLTSAEWAATTPVDEGTRRVATDGLRILFDPHGVLGALTAAIAA